VTLAGVLVGSATEVPAELHLAAAVILAVLAAALGIDLSRFRLPGRDVGPDG
jgi:hypothetical protein